MKQGVITTHRMILSAIMGIPTTLGIVGDMTGAHYLAYV